MLDSISSRLIALVVGGCLLLGTATACAQLTAERLIGDAVSLSNQDYPEIDDAIKRFKNNDVEAAKAFLDRAKEKYPKLPPTNVTLAKMYVMTKNGNTARLLLDKAAMETPDDPEAYLLLADEAFASRRTTESAVLFDRAGALTEKFSENAKRKAKFTIQVTAGRASVAERRQQWEVAQRYLDHWLELDPDSAPAHQRLGVTMYRLGNVPEALRHFQAARQQRSEYSHPSVVLGRLYARDGKRDEASQAFEAAYQQERDDEGTARAYAEFLLRNDEMAKAEEVSAKILASHPESVSALLLNGVISKIQDKTSQATKVLDKVLSIDPSNAEARNLLALILVDGSADADKEKALRHAQVNAERFQKSSQAMVTLSWVLHKLGRDREAQGMLKRIAGTNLSPDSGYLVAQMISNQGKKVAAYRMIAKVLETPQSMVLFEKQANDLLAELAESEEE